MAINRIECARSNNIISFKSIRQDLETARKLKTGTRPLSENKKLNIQSALGRLVQESKAPEIEQMLDIAQNLKYGIQKNSQMSEIVGKDFSQADSSEMSLWSEKLQDSISQAIARQNEATQAQLNLKFNEVFSKKQPLTKEQQAILASRESLIGAINAQIDDEESISQSATAKKLLDYFIISPDISENQKKISLEKLNFFMSDKYKINPQLKDKKLQALTEILNDLTIKTPESEELLIKDVNQRQSGICAAISACRKAIAYEDKVRYLEIVLNELDDSNYMEVYDVTDLESGKKVKADKADIDYTDALRKNYRILDASAHIWMQLGGTTGSGNQNLQNYVAFDKNHYEIFRDSQWYPLLPEEFLLMQSNLRYKIKTQEFIKDIEKLKKARSEYSSASVSQITKLVDYAGKFKDEFISTLTTVLNDGDKGKERQITNAALNFFKGTSEDGTLNFHEKMPKEEQEEKFKEFLLTQFKPVSEEALDKNIKKLFSCISEYRNTEKQIDKIKRISSPRSKYQYNKHLFLLGASHRLGVEAELKDDTLLKRYEQETGLPPRFVQIQQDLSARIKDNSLSKKEQNTAIKDLNTISAVIPSKMSEILKVMTTKTTPEIAIEYLNSISARIKDGDKAYIKLFAEENNLKNSKEDVLKFLDRKTKKMEGNPDFKDIEDVLRIIGFESNVELTKSIFNTYINYISQNGISEDEVNRLESAYSQPIDKALTIMSQDINKAYKDIKKIEKRNSLKTREEKVLRKMEQKGFVVSRAKLEKLESRFDKIYDGIIQNEAISDCKKRDRKNAELYNTFTPEDKETLKSIDDNFSKIKRHTEKTYNLLNLALRNELKEQYGHIGKLQGHFWLAEEGSSGLYTNQTLRILEQMTGKPYYIENDILEAEKVIRKGEGSGITSTSVDNEDYAMHAQYVKSITDEIVSAPKEGQQKTEAVLWHDNTWGRSEKEGSYLIGGRRYTDYRNNYGGRRGYIVNRDMTTGTPLKQLRNETGFSKTYKEIFPLFNNIILPGDSPELNTNITEIFGHIYDLLDIDEDVKDLEQKLTSGQKINIAALEDLDEAAYKYADKLRNKIIKDIKSKEDYQALSPDDPIKLNIEKLALYKALPTSLVKANLYSAATRADFEKTRNEILDEQLENVDTLFCKTPDAYDMMIRRCKEKYSEIRDEINRISDFNATDEIVSNFFDMIMNVDDEELIPSGTLDSLRNTAVMQTRKVIEREVQNPEHQKAICEVFEKHINDVCKNDMRIKSLDSFIIKNTENSERIIQAIEDRYNPRSDKELIKILQKLQNEDYDEYTKSIEWLKPEDLFTEQDPYEYVKLIQTMHSDTAEDFDEMAIGSFITASIGDEADSSYRKLMVRLSDLDINRYIKRFQEQMFTKYKVRPAFPQLVIMSDEEIDSMNNIFFKQFDDLLFKVKENTKLNELYEIYFGLLTDFNSYKALKEADETEEKPNVRKLTKNQKAKLQESFQRLFDSSAKYADMQDVNKLAGDILENLKLNKPNLTKLKRDFKEIDNHFNEILEVQQQGNAKGITGTIKERQNDTIKEYNTLRNYFVEATILPKYRDEASRLINKMAALNRSGSEEEQNEIREQLRDFTIKNHITKKPEILLNEFVKAFSDPNTDEYIKEYRREFLKKASQIAQLNKIEFKLVKNAQLGMATKTKRVLNNIRNVGKDGQFLSSTSKEGLIYLASLLENENTNNSTLNLFLTQTGLNEECVLALIDAFNAEKRLEVIDTYTKIITQKSDYIDEIVMTVEEFFKDNKMSFKDYSAAADQLKKFINKKYKGKSADRLEIAKRYTNMLETTKQANQDIPQSIVPYYLSAVNKSIIGEFINELNETLEEVDNFKLKCQSEEKLINSIDVNPTTKAGKKRIEFMEKVIPDFYQHIAEEAYKVNSLLVSRNAFYAENIES